MCASELQSGFSSRRRAEDNIYIVREIIEKYDRENKTGCITFIEIEKPYDRVDRRILIIFVNYLGNSLKYISIIKDLYTENKSRYILGD